MSKSIDEYMKKLDDKYDGKIVSLAVYIGSQSFIYEVMIGTVKSITQNSESSYLIEHYDGRIRSIHGNFGFIVDTHTKETK